MNSAEKVARGLVVACGHGPVLLESGKKFFDQVPRLVQVPVVAALLFAGGFWGNHHCLAGLM